MARLTLRLSSARPRRGRVSAALIMVLAAVLGIVSACGEPPEGPDATSASPASDPLTQWRSALLNRGDAPARIAVISDSMAEMTSDGWSSVWPHVLGGAGWRYIPAAMSWGTGTHTMTGGDVAQEAASVIGGAGVDADGVTMPQVLLRGDRQSVTWDVSKVSRVRIFYTVMPGVYVAPRYALDDGAPVGVSGEQFNDNCYRSTEIDVSRASTLTLTRGRGGTSSANGIQAKFGASQLSVLNLSRSGSKVSQWLSWLGSTGSAAVTKKLLSGFDPGLVVLPSGGNDFSDDLTWLEWQRRLDALLKLVRSLAPHASVAINTNPPAGATGWSEFNGWTREWAERNGVEVIDWEAHLPQAGKANRWYQSDGLHPRSALSKKIAALSSDVLLPPGVRR